MPSNEIAGFHDDLNLGRSGDVYYRDFGDRAIIQFSDAARYASDGVVTFAVIICLMVEFSCTTRMSRALPIKPQSACKTRREIRA